MGSIEIRSTEDMQQPATCALVSYVTEPLGSFLSWLRQSLPGDETPQPHITILPPRPLLVSSQAASMEARRKLVGVASFEVELGTVKLFPETNILYLDVTEGYQDLMALHSALNADSLYDDERFAYSPHLTLSGTFASEDLEAGRKKAEEAWNQSGLSRRFVINNVVFVCKKAEFGKSEEDSHWERLWSFPLEDSPHKAARA